MFLDLHLIQTFTLSLALALKKFLCQSAFRLKFQISTFHFALIVFFNIILCVHQIKIFLDHILLIIQAIIRFE
jgi:hypothetical protein